jgi:catechol 2,3-dioxygenase-like lactoylglutathione lyase family enzyme
MSAFRSVMLMIRDVPKSVAFYNEALGLPLLKSSDRYAELGVPGGGPPIALKHAEGEALVSVGYSPFLCFDVADVNDTVVRALTAGATLDGAIKHEPHGKVAVLRSPDGHMLGLYESVG